MFAPYLVNKMGLTMVESVNRRVRVNISDQERAYLRMAKIQEGHKLPLFDRYGQRIKPQIIRACIDKGLAERWFSNPLKPDWQVCRLTPKGRRVLR